jgi:superfamily I DNA/RNA helicase
MYTLTDEQNDIISYASTAPIGSVLKISAVAGASKTYTLLKVSEALPHTAQLYLAYNKSIADESKTKFPPYVQCKTTHSLAYLPTITHGLSLEGSTGKKREVVQSFTYRDISEKIDYDDKMLVTQHLEAFCLSKYTTLQQYCDEHEPANQQIITKYFNAMLSKKIPCTHAFYLKLYHMLLDLGCIHYDIPFDVIMLDEAGDINAVTLEIFLLLPANLKIMVGDPLQNIYSFNHTINGFHALADIGVTKTLSQSFRCSTAIASSIEDFIHRHLNDTIAFRGTEHSDTTIRSEAIISRTNSGLIEYMITLTASNTPFNLTRQAKEIFSNMLTLMNLKKDCKIYDHALKYIQKDVDHYFTSKTLPSKYRSCLTYILNLHGDEDRNIKTAAQTIIKHGASKIYEAYKHAQQAEKHPDDHFITLSTCHSSKGLTFDSVTTAHDFDLDDILEMKPSERSHSEEEELRLYYVACSRTRLQLNNAIYINK